MNSITVAGKLGKDAELKTINSQAVVNFTVADSQGMAKPTIWWNCQLWGKRAESLREYLVKGASVTVIGELTEREWVSKEGNKNKTFDLRASNVALQGSRKEKSDIAETEEDNPF